MTETAIPSTIRRLDGADADRLAGLVAAYDDVQTFLRCCDRLLTTLSVAGGIRGGAADDLEVETIWTLGLLSYARAFGGDPAALLEADLGDAPETIKRHRTLMHLRDHHASATTNPRDTYTVGVAQDSDGSISAVAVTSVPAVPVDQASVQQAGAMALPLVAVLDERIAAAQKSVLAGAQKRSKEELDALDVIDVVVSGEQTGGEQTSGEQAEPSSDG